MNQKFYVALVHSSICEIVLQEWQSYHSIPKQNFLIIYQRIKPSGYFPNSTTYSDTILRPKVKFWKNFGAISKFYEWLNEKTGQKHYSALIPHISDTFCKALVFHTNCTSYSYFEEGSLSYANKEEFRKRRKNGLVSVLKSMHFFLNYQGKIPFIRHAYAELAPKYQSNICINPKAFPDCKTKEIIELHRPPTKMTAERMHILPLTVISEIGIFRKDLYEDFLEHVITIVKEYSDVLYVKFHPLQERNEELKQSYLAFLKKQGIRYQILGQEVSLELLALENPNTVFYSLGTSTGIYTSVFGAPTIEFDSYYLKYFKSECPDVVQIVAKAYSESVISFHGDIPELPKSEIG